MNIWSTVWLKLLNNKKHQLNLKINKNIQTNTPKATKKPNNKKRKTGLLHHKKKSNLVNKISMNSKKRSGLSSTREKSIPNTELTRDFLQNFSQTTKIMVMRLVMKSIKRKIKLLCHLGT